MFFSSVPELSNTVPSISFLTIQPSDNRNCIITYRKVFSWPLPVRFLHLFQVIFSQQWPRTNTVGWRVPGWVSIINSSELPFECKQQVSNSLGSICCAECFPQKVAWDTLTLSGGLDWDFCWIPLRLQRRPAEIWYISHWFLPASYIFNLM